MTTGQEDIDRSLEILLSTALGERVMLPNYGSNMEELLFEPIDTGLQTLIFDRINTAILYYEPRIEVEDILLDTERVNEGVLIITIAYRVRATNSRFNFVYPFYLTEGSQVDNPI
jgi:phage baseplate assembly protein W